MRHYRYIFMTIILSIIVGEIHQDAAIASKLPPQDFIKIFQGVIDGKYPIQMELWRTGGLLFGRYFYEKYHQDIPIKGSIEKDGQIILHEYSSGNAQHRATFTGKFDNKNIQGNWSDVTQQESLDNFPKYFLL